MSVLGTEALALDLGRRRVLTDISCAFRPGRVTVLLGPNGAGKSSLLACLAGLRAPSHGRATLNGVDVLALDRRARARRIGFLPQGADVHWDVDARTLVGLGRLPHRGRWGETDADRAAIVRGMVATDIIALADRGVEQLSGGERGRVLIARVLAGEPDWLLADEPLASLDPAHQLDILDRLHGFARGGGGVVLVLHDLPMADRIADDVVLLREGHLVAAGAAADTLTPALIAQTFGVTVEIGTTPGGRRFVLPVSRA